MNSSTNVFENVEGQFPTPEVHPANINYQDFQHLQDDWASLSSSHTNLHTIPHFSNQEFQHIQDDWTSLSSISNFNVQQKTSEVTSTDPKILLDAYHKIKDKQKSIDTFHKHLEKELDDIQSYNKSFDKTIFDTLRLFGRNEEIAKMSGKLSILIKEEIETEVIRIKSMIDENKRQKSKCLEDISDYVKLLKECVATLDESERHNFENPYLCGICVEQNITYVFRPCGHTICQTCLESQHMWNCHICRKNISEKIKVFFS